ncbi:hypothetical protein B9N43_13105 [Denitratisoma sp. DHT3]|uniref:SPOR domain-containing protein n=1 Tax=Denitratisoma sp. DHT3 TaxID=1981880 RepID=UPI001198786D|nr:SPOR domain-containing protein [Denitratisoma sp. DHT3]QDX82102.1 hypothetical protein B9N43_13105 [Denitratisoma sp. DHT3]
MTRDGKPRNHNNRPQQKSRGNTLLGMFIGLVIGVAIAFGLVWYLNRAPLPFQERAHRAEEPAAASQAESSQAPLPLPGKPGDKVTEKPRFEFYKILPGGQEGAAPGATPPAADGEPRATAPAAQSPQFLLQAGAFQKPADADNLKAKLALMGVEASVQQVNVADKGTLHRVRIGPFATPEEMNRVRNQLAQGGVQATVVKAAAAADNAAAAEPKAESRAEAKSGKQ